MALDAVMGDERRDVIDMEKERFKSRMIAARPDRAKEIIEMFDNAENGVTVGADGMVRTEIPQEAKGALSAQDIDAAIRDLANFGIVLQPVEP